MEEVLTVQVVEDDRYIRERLVQAIESHDRLEVTSHTGTFREAKEALLVQPDVFLVDLGLPDGDGTDLIRLATEQSKGRIKSFVYSVFGDEKRVVRAIEAGASGYLLKDTDISYLATSIIELADGKSPISPAIASHLLKRFRPQAVVEKSASCDVNLSQRELQILECIAKGFSGKDIAEYLDISYHTVVAHTKKIYKKMNVCSRTEAVFEAEQIGLIQLHQ